MKYGWKTKYRSGMNAVAIPTLQPLPCSIQSEALSENFPTSCVFFLSAELFKLGNQLVSNLTTLLADPADADPRDATMIYHLRFVG
jgi:hypothetical protein